MKKKVLLAVCDILKYVQKNPHAKHTVEGIARYWIHKQRLEEELEIVFEAVDYLVAQRFLRKNADRQHYSFNIAKRDNVETIITKLQKKCEGNF